MPDSLVANLQPFDFSEVKWILTFPEFSAILERFEASSPGPDGLAYAFWAAASYCIQRVFYLLYHQWLHFAILPAGFNHAFMVFFPEGVSDKDSPMAIERSPKHTRLLSLERGTLSDPIF
jgi:hypothetical protein